MNSARVLVDLIKRSLSSLDLAAECLRLDPSEDKVNRLAEEAETLSSAVAQLARSEDYSALDPEETEPVPARVDMAPEIEFAAKLESIMNHGQCPACGGAYRSRKKDK